MMRSGIFSNPSKLLLQSDGKVVDRRPLKVPKEVLVFIWPVDSPRAVWYRSSKLVLQMAALMKLEATAAEVRALRRPCASQCVHRVGSVGGGQSRTCLSRDGRSSRCSNEAHHMFGAADGSPDGQIYGRRDSQSQRAPRGGLHGVSLSEEMTGPNHPGFVCSPRRNSFYIRAPYHSI
jgi:hypothetical protein